MDLVAVDLGTQTGYLQQIRDSTAQIELPVTGNFKMAVSLDEVAGFDVDRGSGVMDNGTVRVVLATNQPLVDVDLNINGGQPTADQGPATSGSLRVCICDDDTLTTGVFNNTSAKPDGYGVHLRKNQVSHDVFPVIMRGNRDAITTTYSSICNLHPAVTRAIQNSNNTINLSSDDPLDNGTVNNTGLREVTVVGADAGGDRFSEDIDLNGIGQVSLVATGVSVFSIIPLRTGSTHTNQGTVYAYTGAQTLGVPDNLANVMAMIAPNRCEADTSDWSASTTQYYYPATLWVQCDALTHIRIHHWDHLGVGMNSRCERVAFESQFPAGSHTVDLTSMPRVLEGYYRVQARADSGTVDVSYVMTGWSDV